MAKLKSLSASMYRTELIEAARRTFCYRSEAILKSTATFAECVTSVPCYVTVPNIVSLISDCVMFQSLHTYIHKYIHLHFGSFHLKWAKLPKLFRLTIYNLYENLMVCL